MFSWRNKKNIGTFRLKKVPYLELYTSWRNFASSTMRNGSSIALDHKRLFFFFNQNLLVLNSLLLCILIRITSLHILIRIASLELPNLGKSDKSQSIFLSGYTCLELWHFVNICVTVHYNEILFSQQWVIGHNDSIFIFIYSKNCPLEWNLKYQTGLHLRSRTHCRQGNLDYLVLTLVLLNPDTPCLCKQCRSRSVGFWGVCHLVCEYSNNLDQVIWLAENYKWAWHLNLFSKTRVKNEGPDQTLFEHIKIENLRPAIYKQGRLTSYALVLVSTNSRLFRYITEVEWIS